MVIIGCGLYVVGIILIANLIEKNPNMFIFFKGDSGMLLDRNAVGWVLFSNTDVGPIIKQVKSEYFKLHNIDEDVILKFGIQGLIFAFGDDSINTSISISPISGTDNIAIFVTFIHKDFSVQDIRMNHQSLSLFSLVMPFSILKTFNEPLNKLNSVIDVTLKFVEMTDDIHQFAEISHLDELSKELLDLFV